MTYIDYETCSECGFQMAYGGECGECADRRPKAARTPADDTGEVAALIGAIDAHHAALSEDVLLEAIVQEVLATDGLTETSSGGLYSVHEDDLEVLAKAALCTVRAADDAGDYAALLERVDFLVAENRRQASGWAADKVRANEARAEADRLRVALGKVEALAEKWLARIPHHSGAFYPEASAYDDGKDTATDACADDLRTLLADESNPR